MLNYAPPHAAPCACAGRYIATPLGQTAAAYSSFTNLRGDGATNFMPKACS